MNSTGAAGLEDKANPFRLSPGDAPKSLTVGKSAAGFGAQKVGTSRIMAADSPFGSEALSLQGQPIKARYVPSTVNVVDSVE